MAKEYYNGGTDEYYGDNTNGFAYDNVNGYAYDNTSGYANDNTNSYAYDENDYEEETAYYADKIEKLKQEKRKKRRRKNTIASVFLMLSCVVVLVLVTYLVGMAYVWITDKTEGEAWEAVNNVEAIDGQESGGTTVSSGVSEITYTQAQLDAKVAEAMELGRQQGSDEVLGGIKSTLSSDEATVVEMLRPYYKDDLVVVSGGKYHFVPIRDDLKKNSYTEENLRILETGEYQYVENEQVISHKGIDVSKFQGEIDWDAVAADGVEFAFIRVGNRGYGSAGKLVEDDRFEENIEGAKKAGIKVGVYFYTQAITEEELREEAELVLEKIAPYKIDCPVVYDVEKVSGSNGRMNALSAEERTHLTKLFCQIVEEAGYKPMIYFNLEMSALLLNMEELEEYEKWFAYYNPEMYFPYEYKIWQYTDKGRVDGIEGEVDLNISFAPLWE